jgi:phosphoribosyl-AMP cyclohydrolase
MKNLEKIQITAKTLRYLRFNQEGLIPAIIQDSKTQQVLMLAYMNLPALRQTMKFGRTCFWSRSRQELWVKGMTSGHFQFVKAIYYDCDCDTLLIQVKQIGAACHTFKKSCFYRKIK